MDLGKSLIEPSSGTALSAGSAFLGMLPGIGAGADATRLANRVDKLADANRAVDKCLDATRAAGSVCFVAGTPVATEDGLRPIEHVRAGDRVWSFDTGSGTWVLHEVEAHLTHEYAGDLITIRVGDECIVATGNHPFWVVEGPNLAGRVQAHGLGSERGEAGRWIEARCLIAGDCLLGREGAVAITRIGHDHGTRQVHNLSVAGFHTYSAGLTPVVVHNKPVKRIPGNPFRGADAPERAFEHLQKYHGVDPHLASEQLHNIKKSAGLKGADDVAIGRTGDVYDAATGAHIGRVGK
jgi:hypothetical protein